MNDRTHLARFESDFHFLWVCSTVVDGEDDFLFIAGFVVFKAMEEKVYVYTSQMEASNVDRNLLPYRGVDIE